MTWIPQELREISAQVHSTQEPHFDTVRSLLRWFDAQRRRSWVTGRIRAALADLNLRTEPDFMDAYLDSAVAFIPNPVISYEIGSVPSEPEPIQMLSGNVPDPFPKIGRLPAANKPPVTITRDASVQEAVTKMMTNDFSQLPVMQGTRKVDGLISWKSIGSARAAGRNCEMVKDCMMPSVTVLEESVSLLSAVSTIADEEVALIRNRQGEICGLVTTSDLSLQFRSLAEPFLLIQEIENHLRRMINGRFALTEVRRRFDGIGPKREIQLVSDLTLAEAINLFTSSQDWPSYGFDLDRRVVAERLERVRGIRNDVVHFDPDGIDDLELDALRDVVRFLQKL